MELEENSQKSVIGQLTAVHSYVARQKNDDGITMLPSELEQILFSPYIMNLNQDPNPSQSELLLWLSVWRTGFEHCGQFQNIPELKLKHLFNVLVSIN